MCSIFILSVASITDLQLGFAQTSAEYPFTSNPGGAQQLFMEKDHVTTLSMPHVVVI